MLKHKLIVITLILSLLGVYGAVPITNAASITNAKDTLSDSDVSVSTTHTIQFTTGVALVATQYMEITLPADFGNIVVGGITCPGGTTAAAPTTETARCTSDAGTATGTYTISIAGVTNPAAEGSQTIDISTRTAANVVIETVDVWVAIINNVDVSATVSSTLTFEISPLSSGASVNGTTTSATGVAATTSLAFGVLVVDTPRILGQQLRIVTNADDGYTVTVEQDQNLLSGSGSDIDSFVDGTTTAPAAWQSPLETLDQEWTYGHMGFTSEDSSLSDGDHFGTALFQGFNGTTPVEVMYHTGPADGAADHIGITKVAYEIQVSPLQEAGDYYNTLTYIATPTY
jgi:hypothetical protein